VIWKVLSLVAAGLGVFGLYFGAVMLFLVPESDSYLDRERVVYGVLPAALSVSLFALAAWLWTRAGGLGSWYSYARRFVIGAVVLIALFWVVLIVMWNIRQG